MYDRINNDIGVVWKKIMRNEINGATKEFSNIKSFIYQNPTDPLSLQIINWFNNIFVNAFNNPELVNILYDNHIPKYQKIQKIFPRLPFLNTNIITYFHSLIYCDSNHYGTFANSYEGIRQFLLKQNIRINNTTFDLLIDFCKNNEALMKASYNNYGTLELEWNRLHNFINGKTPDDYKAFKDNYIADCNFYQNNYDFYEIDDAYTNQKLSIIGEYFMYNRIKAFQDSNFTAKELGNGFGYDMYYNYYNADKTIGENLIEVKSTRQGMDMNYFTLSPNEYKVLQDTLNEPNANYIVFRALFELTNDINYKDTHILQYQKDTNSFLCVNDNNIIYTPYENNRLMYKCQTKQLILK